MSLGAAFAASALSAEQGEWQTVRPGIVERLNGDGSVSRAGTGKAGVEYRYEQLKARIAELESRKNSDGRMQELREAYASLGTLAAIRNGAFYDRSSRAGTASAKAGATIATLGPTPNYAEQVCGTWWAGFWAQYTTNATTASLTSQTQFPTPSGFTPPPPPVPSTTPWTITSNSAFLTTSGGTWSTDYQSSFNPGPTTITTTNSASRLGYCDGYSRGELSITCPGGANDYAFYERTYNGCP